MTPIEERWCNAGVVLAAALWIAAVYVITTNNGRNYNETTCDLCTTGYLRHPVPVRSELFTGHDAECNCARLR